jgi:coenzyme F420-reducing hydrogenase beta subunit
VPSVKDIEAESRQEHGSENGENNKEILAIRQFGEGFLNKMVNEEQMESQNDENQENVERKKQDAIQRMIDLL